MDVSSMQFPPVTSALLVGLACVTLPCLVQVISPSTIVLSWTNVARRFQIWRPLTAFLYGGNGLRLLFDTFNLYQTSLSLERAYSGDTAAYAWEVLLLCASLLAVNTIPVLNFPVLFRPLLTALVYLWARQNASAKISILGLIKIPSRIYPLVVVGIGMVEGGLGAAAACTMGLLVGHLWWFVNEYLPLHAPVQHRRASPVRVPRWFRQLLDTIQPGAGTLRSKQTSSHRATSATSATDYRPSTAARDAVRHRWGSGNTLGSA